MIFKEFYQISSRVPRHTLNLSIPFLNSCNVRFARSEGNRICTFARRATSETPPNTSTLRHCLSPHHHHNPPKHPPTINIMSTTPSPAASPENVERPSSPVILYHPPTAFTLLRTAAINLVLPFINGLMLGFGELFAHELAFRWGWGTQRVCVYELGIWIIANKSIGLSRT